MLPHPQIILVPAHLPGKSDLLHVEVGPNLSTLASPSTHWDPYTRGGKWSVSMENRWALGGQRAREDTDGKGGLTTWTRRVVRVN